MTSIKNWKTEWKLKSLNFNDLFNIITSVITKQLEDIKKTDITLESNLFTNYDADSVDIVSMLLHLDEIFKNASQTPIVIPVDQLNKIILVEDIFNIVYEALIKAENSMKVFVKIKPKI